MAKKDDIIFKTEDSVWQMMREGRKTWDGRFHDISDERIYRLSWGQWQEFPGRQPSYMPVEPFVNFLNKKTGQILRFRFAELQFTPWAPGWCFIIVCGLVALIEADGTWHYPEEEGP
jgi:hypothetical protein